MAKADRDFSSYISEGQECNECLYGNRGLDKETDFVLCVDYKFDFLTAMTWCHMIFYLLILDIFF